MNPNPHSGKIFVGGHGTGEITLADIEARAAEVALIDGRGPEAVTDRDRLQARRELSGGTLPDTVADDRDEPTGALSRDPSDPAADRGRHTPNYEEPNEQSEVEHLALEGVEEAQHEQMVAARRRSQGTP